MNKSPSNKPMASVWRSFFWKEWHEQKWKLLWLTPVVFVMPLIFMTFEDHHMPSRLAIFGFAIIPYGILAGLFAGMGTAAGEQHRGTMSFLQSLPVDLKTPAGVKLSVSLAVIMLPILLLMVCGYGYYRMKIVGGDYRNEIELAWEITPAEAVLEIEKETLHAMKYSAPLQIWEYQSVIGWCIGTVASGCLFVGSLVLWMAACGVNRSDEIRAGAIGFLAIVIYWACWGIPIDYAREQEYTFLQFLLSIPLVTAAGAIGGLRSLAETHGVALSVLAATAACFHVGLLFWYLSRFGRTAIRPERATSAIRQNRPELEWLGSPRKSQLSAIVWKQVHETGPLALVSVGAVLLITAIGYWTQNLQQVRHQSFAEVLFGVAVAVGFLVTIVAGIGVFLEDMKPQVSTFWRSRPIRLPIWFGVKYVTGVGVLAIAFGLLMLVAVGTEYAELKRVAERNELWQAAVFFVLFFALIYTLSLTLFCLTHHPIVAAMVTISLLAVGSFTMQLVAENYFEATERFEFTVVLMVICLAGSLTVAYRSIQNRRIWQGS